MTRYCLQCGRENTKYEDTDFVPLYVDCEDCGEQTMHGTREEYERKS